VKKGRDRSQYSEYSITNKVWVFHEIRYTIYEEEVRIMNLAEIIKVARGEEKADLLLKNGKIINVFSGEIYTTDVAIFKNMIAGLGEGYEADKEIDISNCYLSPGFMDGHIHLESSMVKISEFISGKRSIKFRVTDPSLNIMYIPNLNFSLASSTVVHSWSDPI